jgi:hypothetical protein
MGGTLEELYYDDAVRQEATRGFQGLLAERGLDPGLSLPELQATVLAGIKVYQAWQKNEIELPPARWTEYVFPNHAIRNGYGGRRGYPVPETHFRGPIWKHWLFWRYYRQGFRLRLSQHHQPHAGVLNWPIRHRPPVRSGRDQLRSGLAEPNTHLCRAAARQLPPAARARGHWCPGRSGRGAPGGLIINQVFLTDKADGDDGRA